MDEKHLRAAIGVARKRLDRAYATAAQRGDTESGRAGVGLNAWQVEALLEAAEERLLITVVRD